MTTTIPIKTFFAPAERASATTLTAQIAYFESLPLLETLLAAVSESVLILNQHRQIVYANNALFSYLDVTTPASIFGPRLGELFWCERVFELEGGCGVTQTCSTCGGLHAFLESQNGTPSVKEYRLSINPNGKDEVKALDFRVRATPHYFENEQYTIIALTDISDEKRRRILERIFFHDITNTAGVIHGLADILNEMQSLEDVHEFGLDTMLDMASTRLLNEIEAHQQLTAAESGELTVQPEFFYTQSFLSDLLTLYKNHPVTKDRDLCLHSSLENVLIQSDRALLSRVIGNMIKNALEASDHGEMVTVGCQKFFDYVRIWVHNLQPIPQNIQLQIYQRSFSTKGNDRGLGTYSMKLLTENYLHGRVSFESNAETGTTFMGTYPLEWHDI